MAAILNHFLGSAPFSGVDVLTLLTDPRIYLFALL